MSARTASGEAPRGAARHRRGTEARLPSFRSPEGQRPNPTLQEEESPGDTSRETRCGFYPRDRCPGNGWACSCHGCGSSSVCLHRSCGREGSCSLPCVALAVVGPHRRVAPGTCSQRFPEEPSRVGDTHPQSRQVPQQGHMPAFWKVLDPSPGAGIGIFLIP